MGELREYQARELWRRMGRICIEITCPFCGEVFQGVRLVTGRQRQAVPRLWGAPLPTVCNEGIGEGIGEVIGEQYGAYK